VIPYNTPKEKEPEPAKEEGKIYNSIPTTKKEEEEPKKIDTLDEEEEWGAVPAFLRRSRLK
jgi:hypothetical protein